MDFTSEIIDKYFKQLTTFTPRSFQREAIRNLLQYRNTILKAPTGSGKTETAIAPFLFAKLHNIDFPNKLIYVVPLRTLANSLRTRTQKYVDNWNKLHGLSKERNIVVTLQTGENPEDPRFEGDIIFCTIDQMLSSFLNIPYSVGRGSANVNAGAIFASYLVFDELHLLDPDRSFATLLKILEQAKGISPFLLMTATLTQELVNEIESVISQQSIVISYQSEIESNENRIETIVVKKDLEEIEQGRKRTFEAVDKPLSAKLILDDIEKEKRQRVIVICNTVSVSQGLFRDLDALIDNDDIVVTLLHSRFLPGDRKEKEEFLQEKFKKNWEDDGKCYILISTQVIEVGINITSEVMHVQLCPMSSLLQRAGRCARFQGETGEVRVYENVEIEENNRKLAETDTDNVEAESTDKQPEKQRKFLPYKDNICLETWKVLQKHNPKKTVDFETENQWIEDVDRETKESELQRKRRQNNKGEFIQQFDRAVFKGKLDTAKYLIRFIDNRNIYSAPDSYDIDLEQPEIDLNKLEAFSVPTSSLRKVWNDFQKANHNTWLFKTIEQPPKNKAETYSQPITRVIKTLEEINTSYRILVNPNFIFYDQEGKLGLRFNVKNPEDEDPSDRFASLSKPEKVERSEYDYRMDNYVGHLVLMWKCWREPFTTQQMVNGYPQNITYQTIKDELCLAGGKFIQQKIFHNAKLEKTTALFEILVMFAILTHDLGKLQEKWQEVMRGWQKEAYIQFAKHKEFKVRKVNDSELLAHTDHKPSVDSEVYKKYMGKHKKPNHAVESAYLAEELLDSHLWSVLEGCFNADEEQIDNIFGVIQMAVGRHHTAWTNGWETDDTVEIGQIVLEESANKVIRSSYRSLVHFLPDTLSLSSDSFKLSQTSYDLYGEELNLNFFNSDSLKYQQLYALVVRALRLCDGRSVQLT